MGEVSGSSLVASFVLGVGFILNVIGFAVPYWKSNTLGHSGLWQYCWLGNCHDWNKEYLSQDSTFKAIRGFAITGLLSSVGSVVFMLLYICVKMCAGNRIIGFLTAIVCFGTAVVIEIAVIMYSAHNEDMDYGFWLSAAGGALFAVAGILTLVSVCCNRNS